MPERHLNQYSVHDYTWQVVKDGVLLSVKFGPGLVSPPKKYIDNLTIAERLGEEFYQQSLHPPSWLVSACPRSVFGVGD